MKVVFILFSGSIVTEGARAVFFLKYILKKTKTEKSNYSLKKHKTIWHNKLAFKKTINNIDFLLLLLFCF